MIKRILYNILTPEQLKQLMIAFEEEFSQFIVFRDDEFIGVNLKDFTNMNIIEQSGSWSYGRIIKC